MQTAHMCRLLSAQRRGMKKEKKSGVFQRILGGWTDLPACTDIDGENKADAGQNYGASRMYGCGFECG